VVFVMEEVTFRMLDSHLHEVDTGRGVLSAVLISAVWGLWHLPVVGQIGWRTGWGTVAMLVCVHVPYGVCFSLYWRKTGNLLVPAICHSLTDAIRNAIAVGG